MNAQATARKLRLAVIKNVLMQGLITEDDALELLRGALSPEDETTIVDDSALLFDTDALNKIDVQEGVSDGKYD
jgi:hypothetical protein